VWLYFRFTLSFRDIEELLASRGVVVSPTSATRPPFCQFCGERGFQVAEITHLDGRKSLKIACSADLAPCVRPNFYNTTGMFLGSVALIYLERRVATLPGF
jgi:hypothetical protein